MDIVTDQLGTQVTRRRVVGTGAKLAYAAPLVAASFKLRSVSAFDAISPAIDSPCTHGYWKRVLVKCGDAAWPIDPDTPFSYLGFAGTFRDAVAAEPNCPVFQGAAALLNVAAGAVPETKAQVEALINAQDCAALAKINEVPADECPFNQNCL